jgi:hypothetical protein
MSTDYFIALADYFSTHKYNDEIDNDNDKYEIIKQQRSMREFLRESNLPLDKEDIIILKRKIKKFRKILKNTSKRRQYGNRK